MKKRRILITTLLLLSIIINVPTVFAEQSELVVPPMLEDMKGKSELVGYFNNIKEIRPNINTIDINAFTAKDNSKELEKQIKFYIAQLSEIEAQISNFKNRYSNSEPDLLFAQQLNIIIDTYKMSLDRQISLLNALVNNDPDAATLFYSGYLTPVYYYLTLGDQMIAYITVYYDL